MIFQNIENIFVLFFCFMSILEIYIDPEINWSNNYRRSNKSKDKKHILCFPDHLVSGHRVSIDI